MYIYLSPIGIGKAGKTRLLGHTGRTAWTGIHGCLAVFDKASPGVMSAVLDGVREFEISGDT